MDISDFYQAFFDEADELMADMEKYLLELDLEAPDREVLNAIFRAAHSIKGGAGTFGFTVLQQTMHILENLLDDVRSGKLQINDPIRDLFLESKDIMQDQLDAYKASAEPDQEAFRYICEALRQIALDSAEPTMLPAEVAAPVAVEPVAPPVTAAKPEGERLRIILSAIKEEDQQPLIDELGNLGKVSDLQTDQTGLQLTLATTATPDDILAVLCFILEPEQIAISPAPVEEPSVPATETTAPAQSSAAPAVRAARPETARAKPHQAEASSIRVAVEKVDQIINQVGELIITQAMLSQLSGMLDSSTHDILITTIAQLERNARDLQESVMSIRMMPMDYVFSRFPRLVHDLAGKLNKEVELTLVGGSAELDKRLIEQIVDPLTHLVRNSLDHGIEPVEVRRANGKAEKGNLVLSAEHHGGNIIIEVTDDGAGLNREKILARAQQQGMAISDNMSDEDVWMLIFAPGFSTAEKVTDVSGRGVGMDVVRRNIQEMGGHVTIHSEQGRGSKIRIILPLTLAILDGMSVRVGSEIYVLPLGSMMESLMLSENTLHRMTGGERMLQVREEYLPLVELGKLFGIHDDDYDFSEGIAVIVQSAGSRYALLVDQLIGQHQVVVKNLEQNYRKIPGISAATILGDGSVALILDVAVLTTLAKNAKPH
ncbi:chemotaxis protein CheA [Kosakonia cowanii]|uniref:chemotaxis protein CheA n=1 Tax=Kosakonia cowanii TaxID=208223 RepID=UPI00111E1A79|nr:chemotaxis protein CheA [Kosakonia cowanii]MDP9768830.1 two-component system chemotaxis sensor kinase CheA [Atlantibacter hermannii]TPD65018.1 chemotaxis protein CheA [Kosakonia cowanii]TPD89203.1 chemotaxis protein CheA [Kosakonia cowanii]TPE05645.1 chemotaxis protein CheA [Kosakonia cowanii]